MISGKRIKERRESLNLSADDLAAIVEKNRATIYRYENGFIETIPIGTFAKIANALHTSMAYLMGATNDPSPVIIQEEEPRRLSEDELRLLRFQAELIDKSQRLSSSDQDFLLSVANHLLESSKPKQ